MSDKVREFKRENRYLVIKWDDINNLLSSYENAIMENLVNKIRGMRRNAGKIDHGYVVVSDDWPMFEDTFSAIEEFVTTGNYTTKLHQQSLIDAKDAEIAQKAKQLNAMQGQNVELWKEVDSLRKDLATANSRIEVQRVNIEALQSGT